MIWKAAIRSVSLQFITKTKSCAVSSSPILQISINSLTSVFTLFFLLTFFRRVRNCCLQVEEEEDDDEEADQIPPVQWEAVDLPPSENLLKGKAPNFPLRLGGRREVEELNPGSCVIGMIRLLTPMMIQEAQFPFHLLVLRMSTAGLVLAQEVK